MLKYTKISQEEYPRYNNESYWIVNPNNFYCRFEVPSGAHTYCTESFLSFNQGKLYEITNNNKDFGWITIRNLEEVVEMPYYLFARYFDAECFMKYSPQKDRDLTTFKG
jgi:hypothetical protein